MMARIVAALFVPALLAAADIPAGSHVLLRMMNDITTRTASEGDYVYLRAATAISVDGRVVAPEGSYVQGVVSHVRRAGRVSGTAELGIRLETIQLPSGKVYRFAPRVATVDSGGTDQKVSGKEGNVKQGTERGKDAARIAISAGTGASIGAIADRSLSAAGIGAAAGGAAGFATVLLTRGRDVELRQGSTMDVVFDRAVALE
jgi:hypothetical protein